jgi:uncharacterized protein involved in exopolysaccharide biosynthesis
MNKEKEISLRELKIIARNWYLYLLSKWHIFLLIAITSGLLGVLFAWLDKPVYTAQLTFASENESSGNLSSYAGLAAQFGLDLGGSSGSAFSGENLMHLMSSRLLIKKTLFTPVPIDNANILLINYYLKSADNVKSLISGNGEKIVFTRENEIRSRQSDSVLQKICNDISKKLQIEKVDKKSDIISVRYSNGNELFAKLFVEELVNNVISYYTDYKVKKTKQNVAILQRQTDSVRNLINGNIVDIAVSSDLNVNPTRQIVRTGIQRKQVDAQVNGALYTELVKNLELSKMGLRKETPLIQIIDTPMLPLEKKKMGRLKGAILFAFLGCFFTFCYYAAKKIFW